MCVLISDSFLCVTERACLLLHTKLIHALVANLMQQKWLHFQ